MAHAASLAEHHTTSVFRPRRLLVQWSNRVSDVLQRHLLGRGNMYYLAVRTRHLHEATRNMAGRRGYQSRYQRTPSIETNNPIINAANLSFPPQGLYYETPITAKTLISDRARSVTHPNSLARAVCSWTPISATANSKHSPEFSRIRPGLIKCGVEVYSSFCRRGARECRCIVAEVVTSSRAGAASFPRAITNSLVWLPAVVEDAGT